MTEIRLKRVYEEPAKNDGARVLVDGIWPRGITKNGLEMDAWRKDVAPSSELRKWFGHDAKKWTEFKKRYLSELKEKKHLAEELLQEQKHGTITLLYSAKDRSNNHALVLQEYLEGLQ